MKYLNEIQAKIGETGYVSYDEKESLYKVQFDNENITFSDELFDNILRDHNIPPADIVLEAVEQVKKEISSNE